jgi:hypothetical protein
LVCFVVFFFFNETNECSLYHFSTALDLFDDTETDIIFHTKFRRDGNRINFNSRFSGEWQRDENASGVDITSDSDATLTVEVLTDAFKVCTVFLRCTAKRALIFTSVHLIVLAHAHN